MESKLYVHDICLQYIIYRPIQNKGTNSYKTSLADLCRVYSISTHSGCVTQRTVLLEENEEWLVTDGEMLNLFKFSYKDPPPSHTRTHAYTHARTNRHTHGRAHTHVRTQAHTHSHLVESKHRQCYRVLQSVHNGSFCVNMQCMLLGLPIVSKVGLDCCPAEHS